MRRIIILLLFIYSCANNTQTPEQKTVQKSYAEIPADYKTIPKNNDGGWYKPAHGLKPGDVVVLEGDYSYINIDGVIGTPEKPIVFKPKGIVRVGTNNSYAWIITNSKYFVIDGITETEKYGFKIGGPVKGKFIAQSFTYPSSDNFEIKGVEISNAQVGFFANPKTAGSGPYENIKIHDNYVHDLDNPDESGRSEGVYLGRTDVASRTIGGAFNNVEISFNRFENLAGDGIQSALVKNLWVHDNTIDGYGRANLEQQRTAIIVGGCSSGKIENNTITNGTGSPIQVFGGGDVYITGNKATKVATSANEDGIYIDGKCADEKLRVYLKGNTIDKVARDFVRDATKSVVENTGNVFGNVTPPPPPPPTKTLFLIIHIYQDRSFSSAKSVNKKKILLTDVKVYTDGSVSN